MSNVKRGLIVAFLFAVGMFIASFGSAAEKKAADKTIRIGALFPFTGPMALLGNETFNGAIIAADMVNEKRGHRREEN